MKKLIGHPRFHQLLTLLVVLIGTAFFIQIFAKTSFNYHSLAFNVHPQLGRSGGTVIAIPPIGQLFLKTHPIPWQMVLTLDEIDLNKLEVELKELPSKEAWLNIFQTEVRQAFTTFFLVVLFWGVLGGLFVLLILRIFPPKPLFWQGLTISLLLPLLLIISTLISFNLEAVSRPHYQGVLASAPWAMNLITMGVENVAVIGDNLRRISQELPLLYEQAENTKAIGETRSDLTVLHVSDIHNNPAAFDLITQLITNFQVNLVIDTGDMTDYGTVPEARLLEEFSHIKIPYLFIPGNHDSPLILERLRRLKKVIVLETGIVKLKGLRIIGQADPAAASYNSDLASAKDFNIAKAELNAKVTALSVAPDILAVHNRKLAEGLIGKVPLLIHGHDHQSNLSELTGTIIDDAGTTGAAGIRGLTKNGAPYSATILYWNKNAQGKLVLRAIDAIKINGVKGHLTIDRSTFSNK